MAGTQRRILVIDDQEDERAIQSAMLAHLGYDVEAAGDGETGFKMALEKKPDIVLLDIAMPRVDGFAVCRQLRNDPRTAEIPVLFFTASVEGDLEQQADQAGASGVMLKPLDPREVARRVGELIGPAAD